MQVLANDGIRCLRGALCDSSENAVMYRSYLQPGRRYTSLFTKIHRRGPVAAGKGEDGTYLGADIFFQLGQPARHVIVDIR